ncbi:MAG: glycosyltransferase family 2 protein [Pseudomonadota bacterium]
MSVIMAVYNGRRFLREQLESVLDELLPGDELLVIDDASTDGSLAMLESVDSPALRIHRNPSNLGVRASFERGLRLAAHDIIFLCDQDDIWLPGKRAAFVQAFERDATVLAVISDAQVIDADGVVVAPSFMATRGDFRGSIAATVWRNRYLGCAMALRRSLLTAALPIPCRVPMHDMWLGAMARILGRVVYLPVPYLQYRRHGGNVSPSRPQSMSTMLRWRVALVRAVLARTLRLKLGLHAHIAANSAGPT